MNASEKALEIATEVENLTSNTYPQIQPKVRKILKDEYSLYIERTSDKKWRVCIDKPETEYDIVKKRFESSDDPNMIIEVKEPKTRRKLKDDGYLVDRCFVSKCHPDMERLILKGSAYVKARPSKKVLNFYENKGYKIDISPDERFPCGCRDMYDLHSCNVNHENGRIVGYWLGAEKK